LNIFGRKEPKRCRATRTARVDALEIKVLAAGDFIALVRLLTLVPMK
jgi:hypothetical protein